LLYYSNLEQRRTRVSLWNSQVQRLFCCHLSCLIEFKSTQRYGDRQQHRYRFNRLRFSSHRSEGGAPIDRLTMSNHTSNDANQPLSGWTQSIDTIGLVQHDRRMRDGVNVIIKAGVRCHFTQTGVSKLRSLITSEVSRGLSEPRTKTKSRLTIGAFSVRTNKSYEYRRYHQSVAKLYRYAVCVTVIAQGSISI
jgi:hypothetical protein